MSEEQENSSINAIQRLYFELLRSVRYNLLDGESVVRDLLDWRDLWYSVIATRLSLPIPGEAPFSRVGFWGVHGPPQGGPYGGTHGPHGPW